MDYNLEEAELKNNKAIYQGQQIARLNDTNIFLYIVYYVLVLISIIVLYYNFQLSMPILVLVSILLVLYPIFMYSLEMYLYNQYLYVMSFVYGIPYVPQ
jgi:hypothetical protein